MVIRRRFCRTLLGFGYAQQGASQGRSKSSADELATLTFTPSNNGVAVLGTTTVTFSGNAVTSTTAGDAQLALVASGGGFVAPYISPTATSSCASGTCTATFVFTPSQGLVNGTPVTYALILNDAAGTAVAGGRELCKSLRNYRQLCGYPVRGWQLWYDGQRCWLAFIVPLPDPDLWRSVLAGLLVLTS